ncbi:YqeB family protein [Nonomuraea jabiensis]|uniref:YqeB family protein n=1 Tax=Nonomuraea jabiensis TaxID=882448 RepID=UPI00369EF052
MAPETTETSGSDVVTVVGEPPWLTALAWTVLPVAGFGLAWLVKIVAVWAEDLPWAPYQEIITFVLKVVPEPYLTVAVCAIGAVAGLVAAVLLRRAGLGVTLSGDVVTLRRGGHLQEVGRAEVEAVFCAGNQLVLLRPDGGEVAREPWDLRVEPVADAFRKHGYTWLEDDPHDADFRVWTPDEPELPAAANAVLRARELLREKLGDGDPVRELRRELAKMGIVVRDEEKAQQWRRADPPIHRSGS